MNRTKSAFHEPIHCRAGSIGLSPLLRSAPLAVRHTERGSVYVIALLTLTVLGMFAAVLGWGALVRTQHAQKRETIRHLESLIQSGVKYASWQRRYKNRGLPFNFNIRLNSGTITGRAKDAPAYGSDAMEVSINAAYKDEQLTKTRIISGAQQARKSTEFALFIDNSLFVKNGSIKIEGDIHLNGQLVTQSGWSIYSTGGITSSGNQVGNILTDTYTETHTPILPENLPTMVDLRMQAVHVSVSALDLPFGTTLSNGEIQYVQGDVQIQGQLRGSGIVVVEGDLIFKGKTWYSDSQSLFVFIVQDDIIIPPNTEVSGYLISKNGNVFIGKNSKIEPGGIVIAQGTLEAAGDMAISHDPRVNVDFFRNLSRVSEID